MRQSLLLVALAAGCSFDPSGPATTDDGSPDDSAIVDGPSTMVTDGTLLKVYAWYDNEMGYACRMVDLACYLQDRETA